MSKKAELIKEMLEMQEKFAADERAGKFEAEDYYIGDGKQYRERYHKLASEVRELASAEVNFWK